ncbi:hypothetical protein [Tunicatimonas pelagia]|uniref:hypothetical protein n=1 Tax=Tunicatimonas pelagia TaxID=931531 RepID=UPI00266714B1|nr:hypothetical protein [Tunicatimonas pelagia]WKN41073.1 hypothetical protein P0M28_18735 [Tunicatimonas pelagia]
MAENRFNQIDRYVSGSMAGEELAEFEKRMREHVELAEGVHLHRDILAGMELQFMRELKERLILADRPEKKINWKLIALIVGGMAVLGAAGYAIYYYYLL